MDDIFFSERTQLLMSRDLYILRKNIPGIFLNLSS